MALSDQSAELPERGPEITIGDHQVRLPADVTTSEAAAITAAVGAHLRDRQVATQQSKEDDSSGWTGDRFAFAGRLDAVGMAASRVPEDAPTDRWTAAGRADRY